MSKCKLKHYTWGEVIDVIEPKMKSHVAILCGMLNGNTSET